jgi:hypothetical protein
MFTVVVWNISRSMQTTENNRKHYPDKPRGIGLDPAHETFFLKQLGYMG